MEPRLLGILYDLLYDLLIRITLVARVAMEEMGDQVGEWKWPILQASNLLDLYISHYFVHLIPNDLWDIYPKIKLKAMKSLNNSTTTLLLMP